MTKTLTSKSVDAEMIAAAIKADKHSRSKTTFIKLSSGTTILRLLPSFDPDNGLPYRVRRAHRYNTPDGYFRMGMDLEFLLEDEYLLSRALEEGKITNQDVEMVTAYGDPFSKLYTTAKAWEGWEDEEQMKKALKDVSGRKTYLWNAINRDEGTQEVSVWESSGDLRDKVVANLKQYPELFDPEVGFDIQVMGNGKEGLARRYTTVLPLRDASPVGFNYADQLVNLDDFNARAIIGYAEKLRVLYQAHGALVEQVGLTLADFGGE
jgi:hypothetical protein